MKIALGVIVIFLYAVRVQAQITEGINSDLAEDVLSLDDIEDEGASFELMDQVLHHPMDLNKATAEELAIPNVLSVQQIEAIVRHRTAHGRFLSVYELQSIPEIDLQSINRIIPFIKVVSASEVIDRSLLKRIANEGENYIAVTTAWTLQRKRGFISNDENAPPFEGSRPRTLLRYRTFRPGDFSVGLTAEKDEGERFRWDINNKQYGFDHTAWHVQLMNKGRVRNVVIGNYQCSFGQGLVFGGALGFGKSAESITGLRRPNIGLVPYTSAYEGGFLHGVGLTYDITPRLSVTMMGSRTNRDGSMNGEDEDASVSSTTSTGLHRTPTEQAKRKTLKENLYGIVVSYKRKTLEIGLTTQHLQYELPIIRKPTLYNQFAFSGTRNTNQSAFFTYTNDNLAFFGEVAHTFNYGTAFTTGALASLSKKFDLSLSYRRYERDYHPFYANAFSEGSSPQNESGIYWGWKYKFNRRFLLAGYFDWFTFPWLRFRTYAPTTGTEWLTRLTWQLSRHSSIYVQIREEEKRRNYSESESNQYVVGPIKKRTFWLNADYTISNALKMRTRVNVSQFHSNGESTKGILIFQDISTSIWKLKCTARYAIFDTDDFDTRLYAYEHDVWMNFSIPAYHGQGTKSYVVLQYKMNRHLTFWLKYSQTRYVDVDSIGSGMDTIKGNLRNDVKFEARLAF